MLDNFLDRLITGNCYDVLPQIPDNSIDLILTSPPYANARDKAYESIVRIEELGKQFYRILKSNGVLCFNIGDPVEKGIKTIVSYKCVVAWVENEEYPLHLHDHYALLKDAMPGNSSQRSRPGWEHMYVYKKSRGEIFFNVGPFRTRYKNQPKAKSTSSIRQNNGSLAVFTRAESSDLRGKDPGNALYYPLGSSHTTQDKYAYEHPALMGEKIASDFIRAFSPWGAVVLDPFNGAGTTSKMAYHNGRHYVGIELEEEFNKIAQRRIDETTPLLMDPDKEETNLYTKEEMFGDAEFSPLFPIEEREECNG